MHLLPSADQGATTKPGRKWRVETRGCCDRCVELLLALANACDGLCLCLLERPLANVTPLAASHPQTTS